MISVRSHVKKSAKIQYVREEMDQGLLIGRSCFLGLAPAVMDQ
jgi:hypothetical protein